MRACLPFLVWGRGNGIISLSKLIGLSLCHRFKLFLKSLYHLELKHLSKYKCSWGR